MKNNNDKLNVCPKFNQKYKLAYTSIPFKRNQDIIKVIPSKGGLEFVVSVIDGWSNPEKIPGDMKGRNVAKFVAIRFPEIFLSQKGNIQKRAEKSARLIDDEVLSRWPDHVSCVGAFLFSFKNKNIIVTIGSIEVFIKKNQNWIRPREIGDYYLDPKKYPSDVSRFIGRGELKNNSLYSARPDVLAIDKEIPIIIATDGLGDLFSDKEFNKLIKNWNPNSCQNFITKLAKEIKKRRKFQKDDIAVLIKI